MAHNNTWRPSEDYSQWIADSKELIAWTRQPGHTGRKYLTEEQKDKRREQASAWREKHREQIRERDRRRYAEDPEFRERRRAAHRAYYRAHHDERAKEKREQRKLKKQGPTPEQRERVRQQDKRDAHERHAAAYARWKQKLEADPERMEREREKRREYGRRYRAEHPLTREQKDRRNARARERFATDPKYREHRRQLMRKQYDRHPKTREQKDRYNARHRQRYHNDPEFRQRHRERMRAYNAERRKNQATTKTATRAKPGTGTHAAAPTSRNPRARKHRKGIPRT